MKELPIMYDNEFVVKSPETLNAYNNEFITYTKQKINEYKGLFDIESFDKLEFIIFDSLDEYRNNYREKFGEEPPSYSRGNFSGNTVRMVVEENPLPGSEVFYHKRATGAHEAFHIFYRDLIYKNYQNRIVWFDEGMAQFVSGQKEHLSDDEFTKYYQSFRKNYKPINNLNERIQGNNQVPDDKIFKRKGVINGYAISYLAIRYLAETKGFDYLKTIMRDNDKILEIGNTVQKDMIKYYDEKFKQREVDF